MKIDISEIIDYCFCPMLYKFRYKDTHLKTKYINTIEKYDVDMHKVVYSFFSLIQAKEPVSIEMLKRTWGSLWLGNKTKHEIAFSEPSTWRDTHNEKRKDGLKAILKFFDKFSLKPGWPIAVNKKYEVEIAKNLILTGTWEVIREVDGHIEIIDFKVDDKLHNKISIEKDLSVTAASYAFRKSFGTKEDALSYYGLSKGKKHNTGRTTDDYKMLVHTVKCVAIAVKNNLFYACPDSKCFSCPYKHMCNSNLNYENMRGDK